MATADLDILRDRGGDPLGPFPRPRHGPTRFDLPPDHPGRIAVSTPAAVAILGDIILRQGIGQGAHGVSPAPPLCPTCGEPMYLTGGGRYVCNPCASREAAARQAAARAEWWASVEALIGWQVVVSWDAADGDTEGTIEGVLQSIEPVDGTDGWYGSFRCQVNGAVVVAHGASVRPAG